MAYVPNPDMFFGPAQVQPSSGVPDPLVPKVYSSNATSGAKTYVPQQTSAYVPPPASSGQVLGITEQEATNKGLDWNNLPSGYSKNVPQPTGGKVITENEALRLGLDWNNLPGGYSRSQPQSSGPSQADLQAKQVRNDINSGFDAYTSQLDQMLGSLPSQQAGQNQIAQNSYNQGINEIQSQKASSLADLETSRRKNSEQQVKTLADIADNIRNLYQTGNVMLGTKGAGDSSAADRYAYAVTKLGSKQRGDVLAQTRSIENDIADRAAKLNNIVTMETSKLKTNLDNQILQVAQFFQDKQNELLQAKATGQLQRGQSLAALSSQLLSVAQQQLAAAEQDYRAKQNSLLTWAENNSKTIGQLRTNLAALGQYNLPAIQAEAVNGQPSFDAQGNLSVPMFGGAVPKTRENQLFGPTAGNYTFR